MIKLILLLVSLQFSLFAEEKHEPISIKAIIELGGEVETRKILGIPLQILIQVKESEKNLLLKCKAEAEISGVYLTKTTTLESIFNEKTNYPIFGQDKINRYLPFTVDNETCDSLVLELQSGKALIIDNVEKKITILK